jgi:homoaconitate hydratase
LQAIDHTVDPRNMHEPTPQKLIKASESFAQEARLVDFHEPNKVFVQPCA